MTSELAQTMALQALAWLIAEDDLRDAFLRKAFLHNLKAFLSVAFLAFFIFYFMNISEVIVSVIDCIRIAQERMKTCID